MLLFATVHPLSRVRRTSKARSTSDSSCAATPRYAAAALCLRGDTITYTQATDIVNVEGQARVFRDGASFAGPRLDFRVDAQTGTMPDADFTYAPRQGRGNATLIEFLGSDRARMENARFTTCGPGDNAWWVQAEIDRVRWTR